MIGLLENLLAGEPGNPAYRAQLAGACKNQGKVRMQQGRLAEAEAAFRRHLELEPDSAEAHYNLGNVLRDLGRLDESEPAFRRATELRPSFPEAHCNLGRALERLGRFGEGLEELRRGHELGIKQKDWKYPSAQWVREAEELAALEAKVLAVLAGREQFVGTREYLLGADISWRYKKLYATAVRLFTGAFTLDPTLAEMLDAYRYRAARAAALVGCGQGADADRTDGAERARLRRQALDWLRADLAGWEQALAKDPAKGRDKVAEMMAHWLGDTDLAVVRGTDALARLPESERADWEKLWMEVEALRRRAESPPPAHP
jgi:tetratricopeptide (TPR) repeat protein